MNEIASRVAGRTADAYSYDRYTNWAACAKALLREGYTERQAEEILRSKITRWAADASGKAYGRSNGADLLRYLERNKAVAGQVFRETGVWEGGSW